MTQRHLELFSFLSFHVMTMHHFTTIFRTFLIMLSSCHCFSSCHSSILLFIHPYNLTIYMGTLVLQIIVLIWIWVHIIGWGTDAYCHLNRLGTNCENLPTGVLSSAAERDSSFHLPDERL